VNPRLIGGILLVSGTTIGAAMLAMPVSTGLSGFLPSLALFVIYWAFMTYSAFLMLEANLWYKEETNLITIAKNSLGLPGAIASWIIYLFLLYALTTAYIAGSSPLVINFARDILGVNIPDWLGSLPLLLIFGLTIYRGTHMVDYVNRFLMIGLCIAYILMIVFLYPHIHFSYFSHVDLVAIPFGLSIIATSFGFHIIIPSLKTYLHNDVRALKKAILIGGIIPLLVYIVWQFITLGVIPLNALAEGYSEGKNSATLLNDVLAPSPIAALAQSFSFFAILTSFLGVALSLSDFLADGLKIKKNPRGKVALFILTFAPPVFITLTDPRAFFTALEVAGAFGVITLLCLMPALIIWKGRYVHHFSSAYKAPGGKIALIVLIAFSLLIIGFEIIQQVKVL